MDKEGIKNVKEEIASLNTVDIIGIADEIVRRVENYASVLYNRVGKTICFNWTDKPEVTAYTYSKTSKNDCVVFSYQFALDLYREACLLSRLARIHFCESKYEPIFGPPMAGRLGVLPAGRSEEQCSRLMFEATLEWVFLHEMAHLTQGHIKIRNLACPESPVGVIEEMSADRSTPLQGYEALISHATEIAADHEGLVIWFQYRYVLNQNSLPYADVYMAVCGLTSLFNRFFGTSGDDFKSEPGGSHPNPAMRWELLLPAFLGYLLDERVRHRLPDWHYTDDEIRMQLTEANALANLQWIICYGHRGIDPLAFISMAKLERPEVRRYLRKIVPIFDQITPEIIKHYIFPTRPAVPVFTEEWRRRIAEV
ncbi:MULTISPECIES: hypothetical protein [Burkholderia]|uniref:hypothetical protein n=1 Tax=Burkholderia TaxID=32008 RepID=UPI000AC62727|nr:MULTISPECIES: hypothetical protein [Burkholderia]